ncbi:MAG: glycosyltransferase family 4 protein, partial [Deltaproteobacteria bacterium]|nr:glycosyltransferase family 4 protein [Deltaproteobacteria bacterium]
GFPEERISIVPNPVSLSPASKNAGNGQYVGYIGRVSAEKGISYLIEMARKLPDIPVRVAGEASTPGKQHLKVPENMQFLGFLSPTKINRFYRKARIVVMPSIVQETFGLVAVEAMANGVPVVAFRSGALSEIVEDPETGRLCNPFDIHQLVQIVKALWNQPALCKKMGEKARQHVATRYSDRTYIHNLIREYGAAIQKNR